ncbi:MAG: flagellar protein C [Archaeoglobus sp.]|nr:MAG: flagellar protein C [Archaeoglobus sp.]
MLKLFKKKAEDEPEEESQEEEEVKEEPETTSKGSDETVEKIMEERLNDIDNKLPRIDIAINNLKKEVDSLKQDLQKMDDSLKDMMTLYEVVSSQINPFVGSSKVTALSIQRLDNIENELRRLEQLVGDVVDDLRMLFRKSVSLKEIVNQVLYEEVSL